MFEYHGAEHKVVFNFESGKPVTVENAQTFTTFHPRCGTSFLLVVMVISMIVYTLMPFDGFAAKLAVARRAAAGDRRRLSYELIRFAAKRRGSLLATLTAPGLWLQRITTKPPSDDAGGRRDPRARRRHGARRKAGRRTGHRVSLACNSRKSSTSIEVRFEELTSQMADPAVISDAEQYRKVAKAHSELAEVVAKYREWKKAADAIWRRRAPCWQESDPELRQMAEEEVARLEPEIVRASKRS